jgi:thymidylate synthase (FAD)
MEVKLISYTQPVGSIGPRTLEDLIAYCARVSNPSNQNNTKTSQKLIHYLIDHKHWSPLEMVSLCVEVVTTRDIARQILRHRSFSFQEFSQRYADPTQSLGFVNRDARFQDKTNRQNSIELEEKDRALQFEWSAVQNRLANEARNAYDWAIEQGIAKEQARAVLPEGMMESKLYMSGTLRSFIHYVDIRTGKETQREHAEVAHGVAKVIEPVFPLIKDFVKHW